MPLEILKSIVDKWVKPHTTYLQEVIAVVDMIPRERFEEYIRWLDEQIAKAKEETIRKLIEKGYINNLSLS